MGTNISATLGRRLRELRTQKQYSQEKLAEKANLNPTFVGSIERGQANPSLDSLHRLAKALDVELIDLLYTPDEISLKVTQNEKLVRLLAEYSLRIEELFRTEQ